MTSRTISAALALLVGLSSTAVAQQATANPRPGAATTRAPAATANASQAQRVVVYKTPTCGCCGQWVTYMRNNGYTVEVHDQDDLTQLKRASGVPPSAESCHTAQVGGYVIEGHVPIETIRRLLREKPQIAGVAVAGMVVGTPGMEAGNTRQAYDVLAFTRDGRTSVYEHH